MSTTVKLPSVHAVDAACDRIAPTWPLDRFIAVNPYWGWRSSSAVDAAGMLGTLAGTSLTMPRSWFREQYVAGVFTDFDIDAAAEAAGLPSLAGEARRMVGGSSDHDAVMNRMSLVTDLREFGGPPRPGQTWAEHVVHEISQHCGAQFDQWQSSWKANQDVDLFARWLLQQSAARGVSWRQGRSWARAQLAMLPDEPTAAIDFMISALGISEEGCESYLASLLLSVNGWAAWCAYRRWQARLVGDDDRQIVGLLAIRLAWEWLLRNDDTATSPESWAAWADSWSQVPELASSLVTAQRVDWLLQGAIERSYQQSVLQQFKNAEAPVEAVPAVQAVFCIDVRSEVFRRALESSASEVTTRGFAGFFGLPLSYTPIGSSLTRPQLPGLLAPGLNVTEVTPDPAALSTITETRTGVLQSGQRWSRFRSAPGSVFSFVESMGLLYGAKLVKDSLPHTHAAPHWEHDGLSPDALVGLRPRLALVDDDPAAAAAIAHRVLRGMGLVDGFAPLVLLCGHGGQSANNPQAAGLDCGACGGQTGEVNARVLADLLNSTPVREQLSPLGIEIPTTTWFVPGLHNTTTDEVQLFDTELAPGAQGAAIAQLATWLSQAGAAARAERAESLGEARRTPVGLKRAVLERANDWSQVRPEWGLAGNAAFVVAPRWRTRHMDLGGRSFLHDYDWRDDAEFSNLAAIMTAPMVVTNWINMQYHASTVDNHRYGTGNKVLHNVVGGNIGVFEGNGGDLRIGLAMQSLHDGTTLRHAPLRLSVFIEAPAVGIDDVIKTYDVVRQLVSNGWINLLRIESSTGEVEQWSANGWTRRS